MMTGFDKTDPSFIEATVHTVCVMSSSPRLLPEPWKGPVPVRN